MECPCCFRRRSGNACSGSHPLPDCRQLYPPSLPSAPETLTLPFSSIISISKQTGSRISIQKCLILKTKPSPVQHPTSCCPISVLHFQRKTCKRVNSTSSSYFWTRLLFDHLIHSPPSNLPLKWLLPGCYRLNGVRYLNECFSDLVSLVTTLLTSLGFEDVVLFFSSSPLATPSWLPSLVLLLLDLHGEGPDGSISNVCPGQLIALNATYKLRFQNASLDMPEA